MVYCPPYKYTIIDNCNYFKCFVLYICMFHNIYYYIRNLSLLRKAINEMLIKEPKLH